MCGIKCWQQSRNFIHLPPKPLITKYRWRLRSISTCETKTQETKNYSDQISSIILSARWRSRAAGGSCRWSWSRRRRSSRWPRRRSPCRDVAIQQTFISPPRMCPTSCLKFETWLLSDIIPCTLRLCTPFSKSSPGLPCSRVEGSMAGTPLQKTVNKTYCMRYFVTW